jgi:acyl dehydratase
VKWPAPAYPYDMLRIEIEITGNRTTKTGDAVIVDYRWEVKNQNDAVVIEGNNTCMFKKK